MIQPSYYQERSTLRKVIYAYNGEGYDNITLQAMLDGTQRGILGINIPETQNTPDTIYTQMLFNTLQRYMFAEIGFDTDEHFIQRFQNRWSQWSQYYHDIISKLISADDGFFSRVITRDTNTDITESNDTTETRDTTDTTKRTGDNTKTIDDSIEGSNSGNGNRTEYEIQTQVSTASNSTSSTQDRTETDNIDETDTLTRTGTNTTEQDKTHNTSTTQNVKEQEITTEKFNIYSRIATFVDEFSELFNSLFMQVYTNM